MWKAGTNKKKVTGLLQSFAADCANGFEHSKKWHGYWAQPALEYTDIKLLWNFILYSEQKQIWYLLSWVILEGCGSLNSSMIEMRWDSK